jgi:hypothetical protein
MSSIYDPLTYITTYDPDSISQFTNLSTLSVASYANSNLLLGTSGSLDVRARDGIDMYFNKNDEIAFYTTDSYGNNVTRVMAIGVSNNMSYISASNLIFKIDGTQNLGIGESNELGYLIDDNLYLSSNLYVNDSITSYKNIACSGNLFASTMNIFNLNPNSNMTSNLERVAYSFHINKYNQLELLRSDQLNSNDTIISKIQRIITFGNTEFNHNLKDNPDDYNIMDEFSGITENYYNGFTSGITNVANSGSRWTVNSGSNIYYNQGFVGIGTNNPSTKLHVSGDFTIFGDIIPQDDITHDLGTPTRRFKDLYLSGNSIKLGENTISVDNTGNFNFLNPNGDPSKIGEWTVNSSNVYILSSNIGIHKSDPQYPLDVNGAINAIGYCNLLIDSYTSKSKTMAPTASNFSVVYGKLEETSNIAYNTQISVSNIIYSTEVPQWNNKDTDIYVLGSNVGIGKSNPICELDVDGSVNISSNLTAPNISIKMFSGEEYITNTPVTLFSMNSDNIGLFYSLYVGPTTIGDPYFLNAFAFWNNATQQPFINVIASNNDISLSISGSNVQIKTTGIINSISDYKYPPINLSSNINLITDQSYGNGLYNVSANGYYLDEDLYAPYNAFSSDSINGWWGEDNAYDIDGNYIGLGETGGVLGDWLQLRLPRPIILKSYSIDPSTDFYSKPVSWQVDGSSDESAWSLLDSKQNYDWSSTGPGEINFPVINTSAFDYYRITTTKLGPNGYIVHIKTFTVHGLHQLKYPWSLYKM